MTTTAGTLTPILLAAPEICGHEWDYVKECLDTGWVSSAGTFVNRFEAEVAARVGMDYAVATTSGTAALHVALIVAGVEPGDEVLTSTLTFIAPANAIRYLGAWPVFIDADPEYWQMDPAQVVDFLDRQCRWENGVLYNQNTGRRVRAILPVHILGHPVDMDPILEAARKYHLPVVEDATEGLGALYKGHPVGSLGDISCFSFNGNKIITTGGGGMIVTANREWADRARYLTTQAKEDPIEYVHREIGFNYRLTNIQAAIGCAQLEQLDKFIAAKRNLAVVYSEHLARLRGLTPMQQAEWACSTFWLYTVLVDEDQASTSSRILLQALAKDAIQSRPLWQPLHLSPAHAQSPTSACPVAERLFRQGLSLPCSAGLDEADQHRVIKALAANTTRVQA